MKKLTTALLLSLFTFSVAQADDLPVQILRVAQCSVSLYSTVVLRPQKIASAFKDELREAIFSVMQKEEVCCA